MYTFVEAQCPNVNCEKEAGGASWRISIGMPGSAGYLAATDLTRGQASALQEIIRLSMQDAVRNTQRSMRIAIGADGGGYDPMTFRF